jgi:hypothetical protein
LDNTANIDAFELFGKFLHQFSTASFNENQELDHLNRLFRDSLNNQIKQSEIYNPWFTEEFIRYAITSISSSLKREKIITWLEAYPEIEKLNGDNKMIGLIMAGNIPLVGFHDLLSCVFSGHKLLAKLSSKDAKLFPLFKEILCVLNPDLEGKINFTDQFLKNIDAIIATGSNNSARYFEYYFSKYPHIIRKNRNSAAIISGDETRDDLSKLGDDIFLYFGLGCRNVSKLFFPEGYDPASIISYFDHYSYLYNHNKYANIYDYYKAIYLVNMLKHLDSGFLLLKEDNSYSSPAGVIYYEFYKSINTLINKLDQDKNLIQCIVARKGLLEGTTNFGESQFPELWNYADNIDTLKFLLNLYKN